MGYNLNALIGLSTVDIDMAKKLGLPMIFENNFVIIPLIEDNLIHYEIENDIDCADYSDELSFDTSTVALFADLLQLSKYVVTCIDGSFPYSSLYSGSDKILHEVHINEALEFLGVVADNETKPFDTLNLDSYRQGEIYYYDFKCVNNENSNVIKGKQMPPDFNSI